MHAVIFYRNMHIAKCNIGAICCILRCNRDSFLLNQKGLEEVSILPKIFYNMHIIVRRNMHIAIESILPLTISLLANPDIPSIVCFNT
jgi:hypothetical protein